VTREVFRRLHLHIRNCLHTFITRVVHVPDWSVLFSPRDPAHRRGNGRWRYQPPEHAVVTPHPPEAGSGNSRALTACSPNCLCATCGHQRPQRTHARVLLTASSSTTVGGLFPHNYDFAETPTPYFVDRTGTRCAVAHLLESTGPLSSTASPVEQQRLVAQLAGDIAFGTWLDERSDAGRGRSYSGAVFHAERRPTMGRPAPPRWRPTRSVRRSPCSER
jgi:hypothetical protein